MSKLPKSRFKPKADKTPRVDASKVSFNSYKPKWLLSNIDLEFNGEWGWGKINTINLLFEIKNKISNWESMTWQEILNSKQNHEIEIVNLCAAAQKRLKYLKLDDIEKLLSLRLQGAQRMWGIKTGDICKILWWDPEHQVCPSPKKHT